MSQRRTVKNPSNITTLNNIPITITPYDTLNFTRGVITCKELHMRTNKEITTELFHQAVINCIHIIKRNKQAVTTHVLTFSRLQLAIINSVCYQFVWIEKYIPPSLQCSRCQAYRHHHTKCWHQLPTCSRCCDTRTLNDCQQETIECIHCTGNHVF